MLLLDYVSSIVHCDRIRMVTGPIIAFWILNDPSMLHLIYFLAHTLTHSLTHLASFFSIKALIPIRASSPANSPWKTLLSFSQPSLSPTS